jgi:hypothetical protein
VLKPKYEEEDRLEYVSYSVGCGPVDAAWKAVDSFSEGAHSL